jgi:DNA topoisomerase-1
MNKKLSNKKLVIVESPAKCLKIESYLGNDYKCIASYGHLRKLSSLDQIDILNNFDTKYTLIDEPIKVKQIQKLEKEIKEASEVILATDDDREGEAIAWHICMIFNLPIETTKRIIFHEITPKAVRDAIANPTTLNINLINAQRTRQILDLLVGFTISPILWNCFTKKHKTSLSAGRCQSVALRIIYDNYLEIKNNQTKLIYNTVGYFTNKNIVFEYSKTFEKEEELLDFFENSLEFNHIYSVSEPKQSIIKPPLPLITSTLQQISSNELHLSPKETMKYAQELYENGLITYMRTDNKKYSKDFINEIKDFILHEYKDVRYIPEDYINIQINNNKDKDKDKEKDEPHEAIRPVKITLKVSQISEKVSEKAKKIYHLIWKRTMESCISSCISNYIYGEISAYQGNYKHKAEQNLFLGWKIVDNIEKEPNNSVYTYLLSIKKGLIMEYKKLIANLSLKNNILHYTEAKLVQLLEEMEIGRPSTFSSIVDKIQERKYVIKENIKGNKVKCKEYILEGVELTETITEKEFGNEKNKLIIQPLGIAVMEFLIKNFNVLFNYEYTKNMEKELDNIALGTKRQKDLCEECYQQLSSLIDHQENSSNKYKYKIKIDEKHFYIIGQNGPVIQEIGENNKVIFKSIKKDIDIKKLENGEYTLEDLLDTSSTKDKEKGKNLGKYQGEILYLKKGIYGLFVEWGNNKKSLKQFGNRPMENIDYVEIIKILEKDNLLDIDKPIGLVRELTKSISIRNGKYGDYILYKTSQMKKPAFYNLKNYKGDYHNGDKKTIIEWIKDTYHLSIQE